MISLRIKPFAREASKHKTRRESQKRQRTATNLNTLLAFPLDITAAEGGVEDNSKAQRRFTCAMASSETANAGGAQPINFTYFDFSLGGRGFMVRAALHHSGLAWNDNRLSFAEFMEAKTTGKYGTGLPVLQLVRRQRVDDCAGR